MARPKGFEPLASAFGGQRSIQLSYGRLRRLIGQRSRLRNGGKPAAWLPAALQHIEGRRSGAGPLGRPSRPRGRVTAMAPETRSDETSPLGALAAAARERILILDGAMGTQIQGLGLGEEEFRGARLLRLRLPPAGQQRPPDPDPAGGDRGDPLPLRHGRRRHHRDQHLLLDRDRPGRLRHGEAGLRAEPPRRAAGAARRPTAPRPRTASAASSPGRSGRPTAPPRSRRTSTTRASAPSASTTCALAYAEQIARADRRRRGPDPDRDDLRHAERQGGDLRLRGGLRREGACACRS